MKKILFLILIILTVNLTFSSEFLRIVHMNDFHGHILPYTDKQGVEIGGISRIASRIDSILKVHPDTLILDAGDYSSGYLYANFDSGETVLNIYNKIPFTAVTLGNHEFDYGYEYMDKLLEPIKEKVVCANVYKNGRRIFRPYMIKRASGYRVLIMGVTTREVERFAPSIKKNNIKITDPAGEVRKIINENRNRADIFILLSHTGFEDDIKIAKEFSDLDIIIGGHTHTNVKVPPLYTNTLVNQAYNHGERLGYLRLAYDEKDGDQVLKYYNTKLETPLKVWGNVEKIDLLINQAKQKVLAISNQVIGNALDSFYTDKKNVRNSETSIGNMICDGLKELSNADFAVMNGGGIRSSIDKGPITVADVEKVLPFKNNAVVIKIKGKEVKKAFENSVKALLNPKLSGAFLQVSGLIVEYDLEKEKAIVMDSNGKELSDDKEYVFALNTYILSGGDGYFFKEFEKVKTAISDKPLKDVVVSYIKHKKDIKPYVDGRIK